ncbi:MAG TPA: phosphatase PAP2 family protein [Lacipirellulaceae bacterium]
MQTNSVFERIKTWAAALVPNLEPIALAVLAVGTASLWGFIEIAEEVLEGDTQAFDHWVLGVLRDSSNPADPIGPRWIEEMARDATALGGFAWITFTTLVIAIYLWLVGKTRLMIFTLMATIGGALVSIGLKSFYNRSRPDIVPHLAHVYTSSFPSGHSMISAVVYLTLGSLLAAIMPNLKLKIYVLSVALLLSVFVGISRIYLGVHYPTDVLAGWLAGLVWALVCWLIARWLQVHGKVEAGPPRAN